jgi:hypothetical protein
VIHLIEEGHTGSTARATEGSRVRRHPKTRRNRTHGLLRGAVPPDSIETICGRLRHGRPPLYYILFTPSVKSLAEDCNNALISMKNIKQPHTFQSNSRCRQFSLEGNFSLEDDERLLSAMPEALSGPLFDGHDVKTSDV